MVSCSDHLINLAYGARYEDAGPVLRILVAVVPLTAVGAISTALLVGYGKMRIPIVVAAISALTDIVAAALLVPRMDAIGAAIANDLAVLAATVILLIYCVRLLGLVEIAPRHLLRMAALSAAAAAASQGALELGYGSLSLLLAFVVGIGLLSALAVRFGVLPQEDALWLGTALGDTRARWLGRVCRRLAGDLPAGRRASAASDYRPRLH